MPEHSKLELTILMPCLNESETLPACVEEAMDWLRKSGVSGEVLVADNGSTDGSQEIARQNGARVVDVSERGYGAALINGANAAKGKYIIMGDSDCSYDFGNLDAFIERLRDGCDLVIGNRFRGGIAPSAMPWKNRYIGNPILSGIGRLLFKINKVKDFHCGLRGFSREAFDRMDLRTTGMEFASEMIVKAALLKMRIEEVPTILRKDGRSRPPHLRPWRDGWRHLSFLLLYSPRWLFLYPGLILVLFGLLWLILLTFGDIDFGYVIMSVNTQLISAGAFLLGIQIVAFSIFTKIIMMREKLLPEDSKIDRIMEYKELVLVTGIVCFVAGLVLIMWGVTEWSNLMHGNIAPFYVINRIIPAVTLLIFGGELIAVRLFLAVLTLKTLRNCY